MVGARPAVVIAALLLAACGSGNSTQQAHPPTAAEIIAKPHHANVKDAHFALSAHIASGGTAFDATGDGLIVIKPQQASQFTLETTISGQPLKFEVIIVGGKEYDLSPDNPRWTEKPSSSSGPVPVGGKNATLLGEETLKLGKAWHVKATDENGDPFEAWVRESDGYPLKYTVTSQGTSFVALFDRFNTGQTISAPPSSDIQQ